MSEVRPAGWTMPPKKAGASSGAAIWLVHALGDSSDAFEALFRSRLGCAFQLAAPDWSGAGDGATVAFDNLAEVAAWLAASVEQHTPGVPVGLVGHSLGAAVAVRAVSKLERVVGLFSIEGNLTAADAYFSGLATTFDAPAPFRDHLLGCVRGLAENETSERSEALWRYHASLRLAAPEALWRIGRNAHAASRLDGLGEEYRALSIPSLYYWSRTSTPPETPHYIQRHRLRSVEFAGGHWPMIETPEETAGQIGAFFQPLLLAYDGATDS